MKRVAFDEGRYEFELSSLERDLLVQLLQLYPRVPSGYQSLSASKQVPEEDQRLLDQALNESRAENQLQLGKWFENPENLSRSDKAWRLKASPAEVDWLLELLNDVRVGSWVRLGSPETPVDNLTAENAPDLWALEMAGIFQGAFLELLEG